MVLRPGSGLTADDLLRHCREHLERSHLPRRIEFLDALPRTGSGKLDRRALASETRDR